MRKLFILLTVAAFFGCNQSVIPENIRTLSERQKCTAIQREAEMAQTHIFVDNLPVHKLIARRNEIVGINCACYHNSERVDWDTIYLNRTSTIDIYDYKDSLKVTHISNGKLATFK